jgi:hypothetical protein
MDFMDAVANFKKRGKEAFYKGEQKETALCQLNKKGFYPVDSYDAFLAGWREAACEYEYVKTDCEKDPRRLQAWRAQQLKKLS